MAPNIALTRYEVYELVSENKYKVDPSKKYMSRDIDGRYKNSPDLPALALPGGDAGELAIMHSASNTYGFTLDEKKALKTLVDLVGGAKNFSLPDGTQIDKVQELISEAKKSGAVETINGNHNEVAVIQIEGEMGILPQFALDTDEGKKNTQVFIYHKTLVDERHKILAKKLIEDKAVVLYDDLDENYLAHVLSETAESHLFETLKRLAKGLPLYNITFKNEQDFKVEEMGSI